MASRAEHRRRGRPEHLGREPRRERRGDGCAAFLRTVPLLRFSAVRPEDVDTEQEDHAADEWRYACMSRPIAPRIELPAPARVWNPLEG